MCALEWLFKDARIRESKCISRCNILPIFETWAPSSCNIYRRSYSYACTGLHRTRLGQAARNGRFRNSNLSSLWRALQSAVAADAHRRSRTEDKGLYRMSALRGGLLNRVINTLLFELHISASFTAYEATNQRWRRHKSAGRDVPRIRHCVFSNDLTDRYMADKVLANKALGRVIAREIRFWERKPPQLHRLGTDERQNQSAWAWNREEEDEEKADKKTDISNSETRRCVTISTNIGTVNVVKAVNDSKTTRRQLEELQCHDRTMEQGHGLYIAPYKYGYEPYLSPYKHGQGVAAKKKRR